MKASGIVYCAAWLLSLFGPGSVALAQGAYGLVAPAGFYLAAPPAKGKAQGCPDAPAPYTGALMLPSKYAGSDAARDKLSTDAYGQYLQLTADLHSLETGVSKFVSRYLKKGIPAYAECALDWLSTWAEADALLSQEYSHTGKSARKWALATVSSAYLRLKFSRSQPLVGHAEQVRKVELWLGKLADQVVLDWDEQPLNKRNNHQYWAAWAVMSSAVALDRQDLFAWSVAQYRHGMQEVDGEGYLPLELSRQTRALAYHNYSLGPLLMIAAFAQANGLDVRADNHGALQRLAERVEHGVEDPQPFKNKTGYAQNLEDLHSN